MNRVATIVSVLLIVSAVSVSCGTSDEPAPPPTTPTGPFVYDLLLSYLNRVTLEEARSIVPFEVTLPSFLPEGVSDAPVIEVSRDSRDGSADDFTAMYWEDKSAPLGVPRLRIRIDEDNSHMSLSNVPPNKLMSVAGEQVSFEASPEGPHSNVWAAWNHEGVAFQVIFAWLSADGKDLGYVSEEMRADALKVIESMIQ